MKFVAEYSARGDTDSMTSSINAALLIQMVTGVSGALILVTCAEPILHLMNVESSSMAIAKTALQVSGGGFLFTMLAGTMTSILAGLQRFDVVSLVSNTITIGITVATVIVLIFGAGLLECAIVAAAGAVLLFLVGLHSVRRLLPMWQYTVRVNWPMVRGVLSFSLFVFVTKITDSVNNYMTRFVLSALIGPAAVTLYVVPSKLLNGAWGILGSGFGVLFPYASNVQSRGDQIEAKRKWLQSSQVFASISLPAFVLIMLFSPWILRLWMGYGFAAKTANLLSLLAIASMIASLTAVPIHIALGYGRSKTIAGFGVITASAYVISLFLLLPNLGIMGAAVAAIVSALPGLILVVVIVRSVIQMRARDYVWSVYGSHIPAIVLGLGWIGMRLAGVNIPEQLDLTVCAVSATAYAVMSLGRSPIIRRLLTLS